MGGRLRSAACMTLPPIGTPWLALTPDQRAALPSGTRLALPGGVGRRYLDPAGVWRHLGGREVTEADLVDRVVWSYPQRRGRKALPEGEGRDVVIRVKLTPAELADVDRQAGGERKRSAWVRERLGFRP